MEGLLAFIQPFTVPVSLRERHERGEAISARSQEPVRASLGKSTRIIHAVGDLARAMATTEDLSTFRSAEEIQKAREGFADFLFHLTTLDENEGDAWSVGPQLWDSYVQARMETVEAIEGLLAVFDQELERQGGSAESVEQQTLRQKAMVAVAGLQGVAEQAVRLSHEEIDQLISDHRSGKP